MVAFIYVSLFAGEVDHFFMSLPFFLVGLPLLVDFTEFLIDLRKESFGCFRHGKFFPSVSFIYWLLYGIGILNCNVFESIKYFTLGNKKTFLELQRYSNSFVVLPFIFRFLIHLGFTFWLQHFLVKRSKHGG